MKKSQRDTYLGATGCLTASRTQKEMGFYMKKRRERGLDVCFQKDLMSLHGSSVFGRCALCKEQDLNISKSYWLIEWSHVMTWLFLESQNPGWSRRKNHVPLVNSWWRHFTNIHLQRGKIEPWRRYFDTLDWIIDHQCFDTGSTMFLQ